MYLYGMALIATEQNSAIFFFFSFFTHVVKKRTDKTTDKTGRVGGLPSRHSAGPPRHLSVIMTNDGA